MSSSDSDDDCYGNIAQKLQTIKNTYVKEKDNSVVSNDTKEDEKPSETLSITDETPQEIIVKDCNITVNSTDNDEFTLDAIIANNSKPKPKRGRGAKRKTTGDTSGPTGRETRSTRRKTANSRGGRTSPVGPGLNTAPVEQNTAPVVQNTAPVVQNTAPVVQNSEAIEHSVLSRRGSGSARGRGARGRNRGTPRSRGRGRRNWLAIFDSMFGFPPVNPAVNYPSVNYPTYSVGNTDEYPDQCDNQQLFATKPVNNDVEIIEEVDPLDDDNEEMSVKVYWQNLEIFKFKIRKYQKLTQIFDYFTEKEGVSNDKLLFTYNDRILKIDDTPDSINYSIAKFIDGGIVNQNVTHLVQKDSNENVNNGLKIKFQCQNKKKPFETMLRPQDKLALAMMKCAEHLETPLERLKFYFDGDLVTSKNTPQELELEGGECIDVKICS